jgi:hypothetical protein
LFVPQDLHTINLEPYQYGGTNITGLQIVDLKSTVKAVKKWGNLEAKKGKTLSISPENFTVRVCVVYIMLLVWQTTSFYILPNS